MKNVMFILLLLIGSGLQCIFAQDSSKTDEFQNPVSGFIVDSDMTEEEKKATEALQKEGVALVKRLGDNLSRMVNPKIRLSSKRDMITVSVKMFYDSVSNFIEVKLASGVPHSYKPSREYFEKITKLGYRTASLTWSEVAYVNNIVKGQNNRYYATITVNQVFNGTTYDGRRHKSKVSKNINIIMEQRRNTFTEENEWVVKLGDIYMSE